MTQAIEGHRLKLAGQLADEQLQRITTLGFRGEALAFGRVQEAQIALGERAAALAVRESRTVSQTPVGC